MNTDVKYNFLNISHFYTALIILHSRISSLGYCHNFLDVSLGLHLAVEGRKYPGYLWVSTQVPEYNYLSTMCLLFSWG